ncbi:6455_t:CDS:10 [Paraglomus brasilianum]|uniref:6455_t:CDS:1 n=1 Tax=Paraglomus brasilianum TaxID=144538 RepID=A0A9N8YZ16_9GLOM|nr:6455_t:CDS:10 [Paraglomus brasilianum]
MGAVLVWRMHLIDFKYDHIGFNQEIKKKRERWSTEHGIMLKSGPLDTLISSQTNTPRHIPFYGWKDDKASGPNHEFIQQWRTRTMAILLEAHRKTHKMVSVTTHLHSFTFSNVLNIAMLLDYNALQSTLNEERDILVKYPYTDSKLMKLTPWMLDVVDTPQFQRLRNVKQLGSVKYVFPNAKHTRFDHCLGVGVLANSLISRFQRDQKELKITDREVKCVTIAGLCHDLGHGPFSHVFDNIVVPRLKLGGEKWSHEKASEMMVNHLANDLEFLDDDDIKVINQLIIGTPPSKDRTFLFDIVANERNSVDVDKFDYLQRDSHYTGFKQVYDIDRLMLSSKVVNYQIAYPCKERQNLYDMFHARYNLFKRVYTHTVVEAVDEMIADALIAAKDHFSLAQAIDDPELYIKLDDNILRQIEHSSEAKLEKSREILKRLRKKQFYKFVGECPIPADCLAFDESPMNYVSKISSCGEGLSEEDVIVKIGVIKLALHEETALDHIDIKFYDDVVSRTSTKYKVPEEKYLRVFVRNAEKAQSVKAAFEKYCAEEADSFKPSGNSTPSYINGYSPISAS